MKAKDFITPPKFISGVGDALPLPPHKPTESQLNTAPCDPKTKCKRYQLLVEDEITGKKMVWTFGQKVYDQLKNLPPGKKSITIKGT